jgi:hypothetical protein
MRIRTSHISLEPGLTAARVVGRSQAPTLHVVRPTPRADWIVIHAMPRLRREVVVRRSVGRHTESPTPLAADCFSDGLERRIEIDAILASPFGDVEVPGILAGAAEKSKAVSEFEIVPQGALLPPVRIKIFVTHTGARTVGHRPNSPAIRLASPISCRQVASSLHLRA